MSNTCKVMIKRIGAMHRLSRDSLSLVTTKSHLQEIKASQPVQQNGDTLNVADGDRSRHDLPVGIVGVYELE